MAGKSSTSKKPKKKRKERPVLLQDFSRLSVNLLETLENDDGTYVDHTFISQKVGGANKLWKLDELEGTIATVSTGDLGNREVINPSVELPNYKHYVLTEEGLRWAQGLLLENHCRR